MINEKRFIIIISISLLILFILKALLHSEDKNTIIRLKQVSYVKTDKIYLKDISLIIGNKSLNQIIITNSPSPGQFIFINKNFIKNIILSKNIKNFKILGPENIKIIRQSFVYSKEIIQKLIYKFLKNNSDKIFGHSKWQITQIIAPPKVLLPYENVDIKITCDNEHITNRLILKMQFINQGTILKRISVMVFFNVFKKVIIAKRDIRPYQIITQDFIQLKEVKIKNFNQKYFDNFKSVIGKQATRFIKKGSLIKENMVKRPPAIKRGSLVKVVATDGGIIITTIGKALENGFINSRIKVMNINSGKIFIGKIIAPNQVMVRF